MDIETVFNIPAVELSGTPYDMGLRLGRWDRRNIHRILAHHVDAVGWPGSSLVDVESLEIDSNRFWGAEGLEELHGMADGAGVPVENLIYHNLQKYAVGACTHFAGCFGTSGKFYHGANIDVPSSLLLKDSMSYHLQYRRPKGGIPYVVPGMPGVLLGIGGFNEKGLFLSSSMLLDVPQPKRLDGTVHGVIVSRLLQSCRDLDEAARFLSVTAGWGGWSIAVSSPKEKRVVYAEYHGDRTVVDRESNRFICSNHSRLFPVGTVPEHSRQRGTRLEVLLDPAQTSRESDFRPEKILFDQFNSKKETASRFRTMSTVFRVDHAVSLLADETGEYRFALSGDAEKGDLRKFKSNLSQKG